MGSNNEFKGEIMKLAAKHLLDEDIILICSCKPKPCHGDRIKEAIELLAVDLLKSLPIIFPESKE